MEPVGRVLRVNVSPGGVPKLPVERAHVGPLGLTGDAHNDDIGIWTRHFLRARANSIEGGTTEILKNITAERVLGLPR